MKNIPCAITILAVLLLNCLTAHAVSMGQIMGRVALKENGEGVANAQIVFENNNDKITVTANEHGFYYSDHMPVGRYQVRTGLNGRIFYANNIRVYDDYSYVLDITVSSNDSLPPVVEIDATEPLINGVASTDIRITGTAGLQATQSLTDVLTMQPGVDVRDNQILIKGSYGVKFYVDGAPVMGPVRPGSSIINVDNPQQNPH